jgi:hypothetical protein
MTRKAPLPPELGGPLSKEEWIDAITREDSAKFYRDVHGAAAKTGAADQARILRHIANEIERHSGGDPVKRSQDRVKERESFPNRGFFHRGPVKPSPELAEKWKADAKQRGGLFANRFRQKATERPGIECNEQERDR